MTHTNQAKALHFVTAAGAVGFIVLAFTYDSFTGLVALLAAVLSTISCAVYAIGQETA